MSTKIISIAGKGGTGKTTLAVLFIISLLKKKRGSILAVDADPNSNLAEFLGIKIEETVSGIIDNIAKNPNTIPPGMAKDRYIEYKVREAITSYDSLDILSLGHPEGPGCYCYANNVLRDVLEKLVKEYQYTIIDNEAGLEHISRKTTRKADIFIVVSDPTVVGLRSAERIYNLSKDLDIKTKNNFLLINRDLKQNQNLDTQKIEKLGLKIMGQIPEDKEILNLSIRDLPLTELKDSIALKTMGNIIDELCL